MVLMINENRILDYTGFSMENNHTRKIRTQMAIASIRDSMDKPFLIKEIEISYFIKRIYNRKIRQYRLTWRWDTPHSSRPQCMNMKVYELEFLLEKHWRPPGPRGGKTIYTFNRDIFSKAGYGTVYAYLTGKRENE